MDERWKCPKCGFHNDYSEAHCASCDTPRPDETRVDEVGEATDSPIFTSYLRDLDFTPKPLDLPLYAPRPEHEQPSETIPGSMPMPPLEPLSSPVPVAAPARAQADARAKRLENLKRLKIPTARPPSRKVPVRLVLFIALAGIAGAIATSVADRDTTTSTTDATYLPVLPDHSDDAYFEELVLINEARKALVDVTNERWDSWLQLNSDGFPTPEYLVMDELLAFQDRVLSMNVPVSEEVQALHSTWMVDLESLVLAEQALATEPDQATLDAELQAWQTENAAFTALYELVQARE